MPYVLSIVILTGIDLISKEIIKKKYAIAERISIYRNFYICRIENYGSFMGFLKDNKKLLNISILGTICYIAALFFRSLRENSLLQKLSYALLLSGGLGNFFDRLKNGNVTDFLHIKYKKLPIFNIADTYIFVGIFIYILSDFTKKSRN